jgi:hypothetical protein
MTICRTQPVPKKHMTHNYSYANIYKPFIKANLFPSLCKLFPFSLLSQGRAPGKSELTPSFFRQKRKKEALGKNGYLPAITKALTAFEFHALPQETQ